MKKVLNTVTTFYQISHTVMMIMTTTVEVTVMRTSDDDETEKIQLQVVQRVVVNF